MVVLLLVKVTQLEVNKKVFSQQRKLELFPKDSKDTIYF